MSGEDNQSRRPAPGESPKPAAGVNPFVEDAPPGTPAPAPAKARRGKPPPGIISAGGVDMARAHASNIRPLAESDQKPAEEAKVVLVAEKVDPRRMRAVRRIDIKPEDLKAAAAAARGESPWAKTGGEVLDKGALPSANLSRGPAPGAEKKKEDKPFGGLWIRAATAVVVLLLIAGVSKRIYMSSKRNTAPPTAYTGAPLIPEPLPSDTPTAADTTDPSASLRPGVNAGARPPTPAPSDSAEEQLEFTTEPVGSAGKAPGVRVKPPPPPPPPKPTFTPLFQLPEEKKN